VSFVPEEAAARLDLIVSHARVICADLASSATFAGARVQQAHPELLLC
jgi:hypothetical protein